MKNLIQRISQLLFLIANTYFIFLLFMALNDSWVGGHALDFIEAIIYTAILLFFINLFFPIKWLRFMLGLLTICWTILCVFAFKSEFDIRFNPHLKSSEFFFDGISFLVLNIIFSVIILCRQPQNKFSAAYLSYL